MLFDQTNLRVQINLPLEHLLQISPEKTKIDYLLQIVAYVQLNNARLSKSRKYNNGNIVK